MMVPLNNQLDIASKKNSNVSYTRLEWVDVVKGLAIIFVVFRHSLVGLDRSGIQIPQWLYNLQEIVYNFRMPLFFIVSGYFLSTSVQKKSASVLLKNRVGTLLYPYILWASIFITLQILLSNFTNSHRTVQDYQYIITQPRNLDHMWYLLCLFNVSVLYIFLNKILAKRNELHLFIGLIFHGLSYLFYDYSLVSDLLYHYLFLLLGGYLRTNSFLLKSQDSRAQRMTILLSTLPLFLIGQWLYLQYKSEDGVLVRMGLLPIIIVACLFIFHLVWVLCDYFSCKLLKILGFHSLYIYILHLLIISFVRIILVKLIGYREVYSITLISLLAGIIIPILVYRYGKKWNIDYLFAIPLK